MGSILDTFAAAIDIGLKASFFDAAVFQSAGSTELLRPTTLVMLFLAGISRTLGTVAILALNQVPGRRYPMVFILEGLVFTGAAIVYAACAVLANWFFLDNRVAPTQLFWIVALAHAPNLLGVLILMPYAGEAIERAIRLWSTVLVFFALHRGLGLPMHAAIAVALAGWLTYLAFSLTLGRPLTYLATTARSFAAGRRLGSGILRGQAQR